MSSADLDLLIALCCLHRMEEPDPLVLSPEAFQKALRVLIRKGFAELDGDEVQISEVGTTAVLLMVLERQH